MYHLRLSHGVGAGVTVRVGTGVSGDGVIIVSTGEGVSIGDRVGTGVMIVSTGAGVTGAGVTGDGVGMGVIIISIGAGVGLTVGSVVGLQISMTLHTPLQSATVATSWAQHSSIVSNGTYVSSLDIVSALSIPLEHFVSPSMSVMIKNLRSSHVYKR
jgi:hypothetical protein